MNKNPALYVYIYTQDQLFEYGLAGIPTIASDFSEIKEYILKFKLGKAVDPNNISEHINAVNKRLTCVKNLILLKIKKYFFIREQFRLEEG